MGINVNSYNWDNETLLTKFMRACMKAGVSGSGLCFDPSAADERADAFFLKRVILARLDGQKPPFQAGDTVSVTGVGGAWPIEGIGYNIPTGNIEVISDLRYNGKEVWSVKLKNRDRQLYLAKNFILVPPTDNPPDDAA